jgi:hypothetical protein
LELGLLADSTVASLVAAGNIAPKCTPESDDANNLEECPICFLARSSRAKNPSVSVASAPARILCRMFHAPSAQCSPGAVLLRDRTTAVSAFASISQHPGSCGAAVLPDPAESFDMLLEADMCVKPHAADAPIDSRPPFGSPDCAAATASAPNYPLTAPPLSYAHTPARPNSAKLLHATPLGFGSYIGQRASYARDWRRLSGR